MQPQAQQYLLQQAQQAQQAQQHMQAQTANATFDAFDQVGALALGTERDRVLSGTTSARVCVGVLTGLVSAGPRRLP
jgi:hypothetical protein